MPDDNHWYVPQYVCLTTAFKVSGGKSEPVKMPSGHWARRIEVSRTGESHGVSLLSPAFSVVAGGTSRVQGPQLHSCCFGMGFACYSSTGFPPANPHFHTKRPLLWYQPMYTHCAVTCMYSIGCDAVWALQWTWQQSIVRLAWPPCPLQVSPDSAGWSALP
jgi:hypothetical protein